MQTASAGPGEPLPGSPKLSDLVAADGSRWPALRRSLTPDFGRVRRDLALHLSLLLSGWALYLLAAFQWSGAATWAAAPFVALWVGFWFLGLPSFAHEAVHYNLHPDRARNDRLAARVLFPFLGISVEGFRRSHWQHHRHLGDHHDTEVSYWQCLDVGFVKRIVSGASFQAHDRYGESRASLIPALLLHGGAVVLPFLLGVPAVGLAWAAGVLWVYPFFHNLRQMLEHRSFDASCDTDYSRVEHGPTNRLFGTDLTSRLFGSAGFNRHLLHHWDPTLSYTRFDEMERFLLQTPLRQELERARTSYPRALGKLIRQARDA